MKVLEMNKKYLKSSGILSKNEEHPNAVDRILKLATDFSLMFGTLFSLSVCSVAYISHNLKNITGVLNAIINCMAGLSAAFAYIGFVINEENIKLFYSELQDIVNSEKLSAEVEALEVYQNAEKLSEQITIWITIFWFRIGLSITVLPLIVFSTVNIILGNFDTSTWLFLQEMEVPFAADVSTVFRWYLRTFVYVWGAWSYCLTVTTIFPFFFGGCIYINACCKHLKAVFDECDQMIETKWESKGKQIAAVSGKIKKAISIHIKIVK